MPHTLDHPVHAALTGPHADLALVSGRVRRYPPDVAPFMGLPPDPTDEDWAGVLTLLTVPAVLFPKPAVVPSSVTVLRTIEVFQMTGEAVVGSREPDVLTLGPADLPEMLDLVARTAPGPFLAGTPVLGTYLGIRLDGKLVAMAGERQRPPGFIEVSAVCTDPAYRGQRLSSRVMRAVVEGIRGVGSVPYLHVAADNPAAKRVYETLGFVERAQFTIAIVELVGSTAPAPAH